MTSNEEEGLVVGPEWAHDVIITSDTGSLDYVASKPLTRNVLGYRERYRATANAPPLAPDDLAAIAASTSVISRNGLVRPNGFPIASREDVFVEYQTFAADYVAAMAHFANGPHRSGADNRLMILKKRFDLYRELNTEAEDNHCWLSGGGDVTDSARVDERRIGTAMSATRLVEFIRHKVATAPDDVLRTVPAETEPTPAATCNANDAKNPVMKDPRVSLDATAGRCAPSKPTPTVMPALASATAAKPTTLRGVVDEFFGPNPPHRALTAEGLALVPQYSQRTVRQPDVFAKNEPLRPRGDRALRLLRHFLKYQWGDNGRYLAEILRPTIVHSTRGGSHVVCEVTIHGLRCGEIGLIGDWFARHCLSDLPRFSVALRIVQRKRNAKFDDAANFEDLLCNVFTPMWQALLRPSEHPAVYLLLQNVVAVSVALDHRATRQTLPEHFKFPSQFAFDGTTDLPPDAYFMYFCWANVALLNSFLRSQNGGGGASFRSGFESMPCNGAATATTTATPNARTTRPVGPFHFRVHCHNGVSASENHLIAGFLLADTVFNAIHLASMPAVRYAYYLAQVHVVLSPSTNNGCNTPFQEQPLVQLMRGGLRVSVASGDPLLYHSSSDAGLEELTLAAKAFHLCNADLCEMALTSVLNSNMTMAEKIALVGQVAVGGGATNDFYRSSVPTGRLQFRAALLAEERAMLMSLPFVRAPIAAAQVSLAPVPKAASPNGSSGHVPPSTPGSPFLAQPGESEAPRFVNIPVPVDPSVRFPRIRICGPRMPPTPHLRALMQGIVHAMELREKYQSLHRQATAPAMHHAAFHIPIYYPTSSANKALPQALSGSRAASAHMAAGDSAAALARRGAALESAFLATAAADANMSAVLNNDNGVWNVMGSPLAIPSFAEYVEDFRRIRAFVHDPAMHIATQRRMNVLRLKFDLHVGLVNKEVEPKTLKTLGEIGDTYRCIKVDTHCHMASGITAEDLLVFIRDKVRNNSDDVVGLEPSGEPLTLGQLFSQKLRIDVEELSVGALDVQADRSTFNRFDAFNGKYNPLGMSLLRSLFLKTDNFMNGRYFAELIKKTFRTQGKDETTFSENRLSIYGKSRTEWTQLAQWFVTHGMVSVSNRWMIQIPRIYPVYRQAGLIQSFEEMLFNIFEPLWAVSLNPNSDPLLAFFLEHVSGLDSVDNESELEGEASPEITPEQWTSAANPSYSYWTYYMYANIQTLNYFRYRRRQSTFAFRPHCGESGNPDHLIDGFLLSQGINHGIQLRDRPALQYLYYLSQIGLAVSPLSNNALFLKYESNPFPDLFRKGLNVTLSTDGALQFHHTRQPLIEEYGTATKLWGLSQTDACEIARNSVLQSGFSHEVKASWLGAMYFLCSRAGNDPGRSHIPDSRIAFRYEVYWDECNYLQSRAQRAMPHKAMLAPDEEEVALLELLGITRQKRLLQKDEAAQRRREAAANKSKL